jgi:2-oxoglutarate ferredoxin oxidoreductase subunit delta
MEDSAKREKGSVTINTDECKGCGLCVASCNFGYLHLSEGLNRYGYHTAAYVGHGCTGCGLCYFACPEPGGITVYRAPAKRAVAQEAVAV